jgi:hypothetical protein
MEGRYQFRGAEYIRMIPRVENARGSENVSKYRAVYGIPLPSYELCVIAVASA